MTPALPYEVSSPGSRRSTSATESPRFASCSAVDVPTIPAPRTIASVRAIESLVLRRGGAGEHGRYQPHVGFSTPRFAATARALPHPTGPHPMYLLDLLAAALAFLGRHGTRPVAVSI